VLEFRFDIGKVFMSVLFNASRRPN